MIMLNAEALFSYGEILPIVAGSALRRLDSGEGMGAEAP